MTGLGEEIIVVGKNLAELNARYRFAPTAEFAAAVIGELFPGRIAVVSSFGTESAVLLHLVANVDPATPVLFVDTAKHFTETIAYREELTERLGLADVRTVRPDPAVQLRVDPEGRLWRSDPDACCRLRKTDPLSQALLGFDAWFTGRKRHHGGERDGLDLFDDDGDRVKVNPLAFWPPARIRHYLEKHDLPRHPLEARGYPSVGCEPCTSPACAAGPVRTGRWAGSEKTECGIHLPAA